MVKCMCDITGGVVGSVTLGSLKDTDMVSVSNPGVGVGLLPVTTAAWIWL
jgi:hypothetical protein